MNDDLSDRSITKVLGQFLVPSRLTKRLMSERV